MGFFKKKNKGKNAETSFGSSDKNKSSSPQSADSTAQTDSKSSSSSSPEHGKRRGFSRGKPKSPKLKSNSTLSSRSTDSPPSATPVSSASFSPEKSVGSGPKSDVLSQYPPTMEMVPDFIINLGADTSSEEANSALRALFSLSEGDNRHNREELVVAADGHLVPSLLSFLRRSTRGSPGQYLALLVLNNVSIPVENKRVIAIEYRAAHILSRLLCEDPSCHLMAIILVNLTFADADLRRELVSPGPIELVDALAYALRIAAASPEDSATHNIIPVDLSDEEFSPKSLLIKALDASVASSPPSAAANDGAHQISFDPAVQVFPETARWCLCALKNLTRPSRDTYAASAIIESGIVPLIFRAITVETLMVPSGSGEQAGDHNAQMGMDASIIPVTLVNDPKNWDANSLQDAALSTVLNMSMVPAARSYLRQENAIQILSLIADQINNRDDNVIDPDGKAIRNLQCLKSRMALSFLIGGEGYYGQPRSSYRHPDETTILIMASEANMLLELLGDVLHQRGKEGAGGYSAATFTAKGILYSIRCMLTSNSNQNTFAITSGTRLNILLLKAIAHHAFLNLPTADTDVAEHACFSLYLLSSFGFKNPFLPKVFNQDQLLEKVLISYLNSESITPAGKHAAEQILLRVPYLLFEDDPESMTTSSDLTYEFENKMKEVAMQIFVGEAPSICGGAKPLDMIFSRPILRSRIPKKNADSPWDNNSSIKAFPSALHAVQDISFGSKKVQHMDPIDDILIANNIACSANGEKTESYNFMWSWEDAAQSIHKNLERKPTAVKEIFSKVKPSFRSDDTDEPFSLFGFKCGGGPKHMFACDRGGTGAPEPMTRQD
uniref:Protein HGH1 homolog n=1 Tax=Corethron hystrix TaxID=216773 RepID=A0A7S1FVN5_9STRA|mmetsp:Transcript_33081/g.76234  ORF Transcript_33081/g.76234 Transcript_33081/m.76234 type:complete len:840 (+) Transcript_33081:401-2920(+)|eukprot:CAMPEP_0113323304 /NCGR_PEP_ID=MMETSP0010_2-20120614/16204_1 /TAXON_ID=216773 ORGANISM="Corethron hystrix, Strain 308" /NCGR_SAMPLE_ID=MMETSP0010_2 /ASSEMBLY_ACC=CAM_ASM_000155 /LENGTH=839 /DNA_ID=CAMNT_0000182135 /DNA_START=313 /DNA_END=2832 /DNA_ORIENTATION=- /assembly_acc=CAM_ASM_000155